MSAPTVPPRHATTRSHPSLLGEVLWVLVPLLGHVLAACTLWALVVVGLGWLR